MKIKQFFFSLLLLVVGCSVGQSQLFAAMNPTDGDALTESSEGTLRIPSSNENLSFSVGVTQESVRTEKRNDNQKLVSVEYKDAGNGLDLEIVNVREGEVFYSITVDDASNLSDFEIEVEGADLMTLDQNGDLVIMRGSERTVIPAPQAYHTSREGGLKIQNVIPIAFEITSSSSFRYVVNGSLNAASSFRVTGNL